jgi:hypothetical protein
MHGNFVLFKKETVEEMCSYRPLSLSQITCIKNTPLSSTRMPIEVSAENLIGRADIPRTWGDLPRFMEKVGNDSRRYQLTGPIFEEFRGDERGLLRFLSGASSGRDNEALPQGLIEGARNIVRILNHSNKPQDGKVLSMVKGGIATVGSAIRSGLQRVGIL